MASLQVKHIVRFVFFIWCMGAVSSSAQGSRTLIRFVPTFHQKPLLLDTYYPLAGGDSVVFETLKYYISNLAFYRNDSLVFSEKGGYRLIDASDEATLAFAVEAPALLLYNSIHFYLGVDSATSTSGAMGGDLDPTRGMFWTWQSGYINLKLEGRSNLCPTRQNRFQFHLGGYDSRSSSRQQVILAVRQLHQINIEIPLDKFLAAINLGRQNAIMIPGPEAVAMSQKIAVLFTVIPE